VTKDDVEKIFDGATETLGKVENEEIQTELEKYLAGVELPSTDKDMLQAVLTPERRKTAEGWITAYNDLIGLPARVNAQHEVRIAHIAEQSDTLLRQRPKGFEEKVIALWEKAYKEENKRYKRFLREWQKAYQGFNQALRETAGNDIPQHYIEDLFKQLDALHEASVARYRNNVIIYRKAAQVSRAERKQLHIQRIRANELYAQEATKARMTIQQIHTQVNTLLGNLNLPHVEDVTKVPVSGTWDVPTEVIEKVSQDTMQKYQQYYDELSHWQEVVQTKRMRPWREITLTDVDRQRLGQVADAVINQVDDAVGKAREYGLHEVNRVLFDYARTNNIQAIIRRIHPFWRWPAHNMPYYVDALLRHPSLVSKLAYYYRVVPQQNKDLPSRAKYSVEVPFSRLFMEGMLGIPSRLYFNPTTLFSILQQLPTSTYKQRQFAQWYTDEEQPLLGKGFELVTQYLGAPFPWWEWLAGMGGFLGGDWYARNALPWSIAVEAVSKKLGVFTTRDEYGNVVGFNPDTWFRKNILSLMAQTFGWSESDYTSDRYRIWLMGRNVRRDILRERGYEEGEVPSEILDKHEPQQAANQALRETLMTTIVGHMTGLYGQVVTPEDMQEHLLREERKKIDREYPAQAGEAYRDAVTQFMYEHPEFAAIGNTYSEYAWANTTDELEASRREAEVNRAKADYWKKHDALMAERAKEVDAVIKLHPYDRDEHTKVKQKYHQKLEELRNGYLKQYPELDLGWSLWGKTPEEIERHHRDRILSAYLDTVYPQREDYVRPDGTVNEEAYYKALDYFYNNAWSVVKKSKAIEPEIMRLMGVYKLSQHEAEALLAKFFSADSIDAYFRQNDTPMEAAVEAYQTFFYDKANKEYQEEIKPQLKAIDKDKTLSISEKSAKKREVMDAFFAKWGPVPAEKLIPYVRTLYPDRDWSILQLLAQYDGVVFPGVETIWENNKTGKDRIVSALWDEWNGLSSLDKKRVASALGSQFSAYFLSKKTRDVEGIDIERLGLWLTAIQQAQGKAPDNWRKWAKVPEVLPTSTYTLPERDKQEAASLLLPSVYGTKAGMPWAQVLVTATDKELNQVFAEWNKLLPWQQDMVDVLHPGAKDGMAQLMKAYSPDMQENQWLYLKARIKAWAKEVPTDDIYTIPEDTGQAVQQTGVPEIELATPEEAASYEKAKELNEIYWEARDRGDIVTAERIADDPNWIKWFGSTPKALFWRYYYENIPPGWRTQELRDDDLVRAILSKGVRAYLPDEAYEKALEATKYWVDTHPDAIVGDKKEWAQVKQEIQEYMPLPSGSEARREYWHSHPLLEKYYAKPSQGTTRTSRRGGGGGGGRGSLYPTWQQFVDTTGELLPVLMGEIIGYLGMAHQPLSKDTKAYLLALWGKMGGGKSFDDWLKFILELWRRYGGVTPRQVKEPYIPQVHRSSGRQSGVRLRIRR